MANRGVNKVILQGRVLLKTDRYSRLSFEEWQKSMWKAIYFYAASTGIRTAKNVTEQKWLCKLQLLYSPTASAFANISSSNPVSDAAGMSGSG